MLRRVAAGDTGRRGGPRRPVQRDAGVRHRRAARRARCRPEPDEPRRGPARGGRPHGVPAGAHGAGRWWSSATTRGTTPTCSRVTRRPSSWPPGHPPLLLPRPLPTPVLAFAIRHLGADAGVMVTASHNPPQDNGYKVYLGDGSQIVPPADTDIAAHIDRVDRVADIAARRRRLGGAGRARWSRTTSTAATAVVDPHGPRELTMVHTSLHGVGNEVVQRAFAGAGFAAPSWSPASRSRTPRSRRSPSPTPRSRARSTPRWRSPRRWAPTWSWPTTPTPTGCRRRPTRRGQRRRPGGWRMLRGDEVGALLGAHVLARVDAGRRLRQLDRLLAAARGTGPRRGRAARGDADRVQVDRPRAGAALRLRGGPRLLRRPALGPGQGRGQRGAAARGDGRGPAGAGAHAAGRAGRPGRGPRAARHRRVLGAGGRPGAHRHGDGAAALDPSRAGRRGAGRPGSTTSPRVHRTCHPPTGCATTSRTAAG